MSLKLRPCVVFQLYLCRCAFLSSKWFFPSFHVLLPFFPSCSFPSSHLLSSLHSSSLHPFPPLPSLFHSLFLSASPSLDRLTPFSSPIRSSPLPTYPPLISF